MKKVYYLFTIVSVFMFERSHSQNGIPLDGNFSIEIAEVTFKKSVTSTLQLVVAKANHKILTFEVILYSKSKKREVLDLNEMKFISNGESYQVVSQQGLGVWSSTSGLFIHLKEQKKVKLYVQVKEDINDGQVTFNDKGIFEINVYSNSHDAEFKPLE